VSAAHEVIDEYAEAVASGAWTRRKGPPPGPPCPSCLGLDTRVLPGTLAWLRCACGHEWRAAGQRGELGVEIVDALGAADAERRRGARS
jgi:hypothetical protein